MSTLPKLAKIPAGWELIPVGRMAHKGEMVCCHPHRKWTVLKCTLGPINTTSGYAPYGYYIRQIKATGKPVSRKRRAKK